MTATYTPFVFASYADPSGTTSGSITISVTSATTAGDLICIFGAMDFDQISSVTDSKGNSYTDDAEWNNSTTGYPYQTFWFCAGAKQLTTADSITINFNGSTNHAVICVDLPGGAAHDPVGIANNQAGPASTYSATSSTLSFKYECLIGVGAAASPAGGVAWSSGNVTTLLDTVQASGNDFCTVAYELTSATTAQTATVTLSNSSYGGCGIFCFRVPAPVFPFTTVASGTSGVAYSSSNTSATIYATAATPYSVASGSLPTGISINTATGVISGTPTVSGTFTFTVQATDGNSQSTTSHTFSLVIAAAPVGGGGNQPPAVNGPYALCQQTIQSAALTSGNIPVLQTGYDGDTYCLIVSVNDATTGRTEVTGITDTQGNTWASVTTSHGLKPEVDVWMATNVNVLTAGTDTLTVTINQAEDFSVVGFGIVGAATIDKFAIASGTSSTPSESSGTLTHAYEYVIGAWTGPYNTITSFTRTAGPSTALTAANPTTNATAPWLQCFWEETAVTTSVTYSGTFNTSAAWQDVVLSFTLPPPIFGTAGFPNGIVGNRYSSSAASASFFAGTLTYSLQAGGTLPTGLTLSTSTGVVSGIPTAVGAYTFAIQATDSNGLTAFKGGTITIGAHTYGNGTSNILPVLPNFVTGETSITNLNNLAYAVDFLIDDNTRPIYKAYMPYTYSLASGWNSLPGLGVIAFDSDSQGGSSSNMQIVANTTGVYAFEGCLSVANQSSSRLFKLRFLFTPGQNNPVYTSAIPFGQRSSGTSTDTGSDTTLCCSDICPAILYPGDTVGLQAYVSSSMTIDYNQNTDFNQGRFVNSFTSYYLHVAG